MNIRAKEQRQAVRDAATLCKRLGPGWKPCVWENMGWHHRAERAPLSVHVFTGARGRISYWCMIARNPEDAGYGAPEINTGDMRTFNDPRAAVRATARAARILLQPLVDSVALVEQHVTELRKDVACT